MFFLILDIFDRIVQTNSVIVGFLMIPVCFFTYMFCWGWVFLVLEKVITIPRLTSLIQNQNIRGTIIAIDFTIWFYLAVLEGDLSNFPIRGGPPTLFDDLY